MEFKIDRESAVPVYCQLADLIEKQIREEVLKDGQRLMTERTMCRLYQVARNTAKRAVEELSQRGLVQTLSSSGSYVRLRGYWDQKQEAAKTAAGAIQILTSEGLPLQEIEHLFLETAWETLPENEKLKVAWVDCSAEILKGTAEALEESCHVRAFPCLLGEVERDGASFIKQGYDVVVTTVNHYDALCDSLEKVAGPLPFHMEMAVLSVSRATVSQIAKIGDRTKVMSFYDSELYRYSVERYLQEFSVRAEITHVALNQALNILVRPETNPQTVILPQDSAYGGGLVGEIEKYCRKNGILCFPFQQMIDSGSLLHLKQRFQEIWLEKGIESKR